MPNYPEFPNKKYRTIVVDPPYPINKIQRKVRPNQKEMDYQTMSLEEIKNFPIDNFTDDNCWIFLWSINKYLKDGFDILNKWNFKFQRLLTWDKKNGMCLFGFHHRTEFVLVGYRGKVNIYPKQKAIPTIFQERGTRHSRKPDSFFDLLQTMPSPRISIFERYERNGFDIWGNET